MRLRHLLGVVPRTGYDGDAESPPGRAGQAPIRYNAGMSLPVPSSDALAASHALQNLIAADIARHDGAISFARFMELALYAPDLGYYSGGSAKLGKDGDFTTAPELTPL